MKICLSEYIKGTSFRWKDALLLREWGFSAFPGPKHQYNIILVAKILQKVKVDYLNDTPIIITSWYRPRVYNKLIGGGAKSEHMKGKGVDFVCPKMKADLVRNAIIPYLKALGIRMENRFGSSWCHLDLGEPGITGRYFTP